LFRLISVSQGFTPGFFAGIIASQVDGDMLEGYNKPGGQFGVLVKRDLTEKYGIQTEIKFIQKGSRKVAHPDKGDISSYKIKLDYVEVPFLFNYTIKKKYRPEIGLGFGYLIKSGEFVDGYEYIPEPAFKKYELSIMLGFNYKIFSKIELNLRYSYSIMPIRDFPGVKSFYFDRFQYNNLMSFALYYNFLSE